MYLHFCAASHMTKCSIFYISNIIVLEMKISTQRGVFEMCLQKAFDVIATQVSSHILKGIVSIKNGLDLSKFTESSGLH